MNSGRLLDMEVAEKVMGQRMWNKEDFYAIPYYSSNIADAMQIVEKLKHKEFHVSMLPPMIQGCLPTWKVIFGGGIASHACTAAEAICRAALRAVDGARS